MFWCGAGAVVGVAEVPWLSWEYALSAVAAVGESCFDELFEFVAQGAVFSRVAALFGGSALLLFFLCALWADGYALG